MTLEQHRVELAWRATGDYAQSDAQRAAWKTAVMGFGTNVHRCGLLQAVVFLRRDDPGIYTALTTALRGHLVNRGFLAGTADRDLMVAVKNLVSADYMLISREVLAVSVWLKRAAQILCGNA